MSERFARRGAHRHVQAARRSTHHSWMALAILGIGLTTQAQAQEPVGIPVSTVPAGTISRKAPYRLILDPIAGTIELQNQGGKLLDRWAQFAPSSPLAEIPADRPVNVVIVNANPLLYHYTVTAEALREDEVKSCKDIGGRFLSGGFLLSSAVIGGLPTPSFDIPALPSGFLDINSAVQSATLGVRGGARMTESQLESELALVRAEAAAFAEFAVRLATLAGSIEDSIALFAAQAEGVPLETILGHFNASLEQLQPGLSDPAQTPVLIAQRANAAATAVTTLKGLVSAIQGGNYAGSSSDLVAQEAVRLNARVDAGTTRLKAVYPRFQLGLLRLARIKAQASRVFTIQESGGVVRRLVITSTKNDDHPGVLRLHEGPVEVFTRPRTGLICEITFGVSWLQPLAEYGFDPANGRVVDANSGDPRRVAPAIMLHVAAPGIPVLGWGLGLGLGKHSAPDLYLGGSLRLFDPVGLNLGVVWQRTPQLPSGLQLGQVASNPDPALLDEKNLRYKFEGSLYFGIGIRR